MQGCEVRQTILEAILVSEMEKVNEAFSGLEKWANELLRNGVDEGGLASVFLEALKRRKINAEANA